MIFCYHPDCDNPHVFHCDNDLPQCDHDMCEKHAVQYHEDPTKSLRGSTFHLCLDHARFQVKYGEKVDRKYFARVGIA